MHNGIFLKLFLLTSGGDFASEILLLAGLIFAITM